MNSPSNTDSCDITFLRTSNYLRVTIKGKGTYLASNPNPFLYQTDNHIYLRNFIFPPSTNKVVYPIYVTLYKSDVVNPVEYKRAYYISANPMENTLSGLSIGYLGNYYTSTSSLFQTYSGALRFASTNPTGMNNLVVQPD